MLRGRGPYWYFRYHEDGEQRKTYLGKADDPEGKLSEKMLRNGGLYAVGLTVEKRVLTVSASVGNREHGEHETYT